jgi:hypothetical protein
MNKIVDSGTVNLHPIDAVDTEEQEIECQELPEQSGMYPKWQYTKRRRAKWGEITRQGLVVGRGDNRKIVPPDDVYKLAALGCNDKEICDFFGINKDTLHYNFGEYMQAAQADLKQRLRRAQIKLALEGNATMLIWLGKNILGQVDQPTNTDNDKVLPWSD